MPAKYSRGDISYVNLGDAVGSEPNKVRPCVVIQNDLGNRYSSILIIAIITGAENVPKKYPVDVEVPKGEGGLDKDSVVQCNLIRCVDEKRMQASIGRLAPATMRKIDDALKISLALR
jgi:mRNA interferase MazF